MVTITPYDSQKQTQLPLLLPSLPSPSNWSLRVILNAHTTISTRANSTINAFQLQQWQSLAKSSPNPDLVEAPLVTNILKLHQGLRKMESLLAIQQRIEINGLDAFLFQVRVPFVPSHLRSCGRGWQTAKHVLVFCPQYSKARHSLRDKLVHLRYILGRQINFEKPPNQRCKEKSWDTLGVLGTYSMTSSPSSPTHDILLFCFEVPVATGNPTEDTPAGRGFYSLECFTFSNM